MLSRNFLPIACYCCLLAVTLTWRSGTADPISRNPLYETVDYLNHQEREHLGEVLSLGQTQELVETIWEQTGHCDVVTPDALCNCLQADDLFGIVDADVAEGLKTEDYEKVSVVVLYHLDIRECKLADDIAGNWTYADYLEKLYDVHGGHPHPHKETSFPAQNGAVLPREGEDPSFTEGQLHHILEHVNATYSPASKHECFTSDTVFHDIGLDHGEKASPAGLEHLSSIVITNLLHGQCIGDSAIVDPDYFVEEIFHTYGTSGIIDDHGLEDLMADLGLVEGHDHDHDHDEDYKPVPDDGHDHDHSTTKRKGISAFINIQADEHDNHSHHSHCYSPEQLLEVYDAVDGISFTQFQQMCPSLLQLVASGSCHEEHVPTPHNPSSIVYLWATLAVIIVTLLSISGIILVPLLSAKVYDGIMHFFMALAVSTLSGDALLHLIPESLGLHSHGGDEEHAHEEVVEPEYPLGKVLVVVGAIYVFFLLEKVLNMIMGKRGHSHSHGHPHKIETEQWTHDNPDKETLFDGEDVKQVNGQNGNIKSAHTSTDSKEPKRKHTPSELSFSNATLDIEEQKQEQQFSLIRGMTTVSAMVLIGDVMHNFMDGIAIGVAFTLDIYVGISTCIAIFCHEFPHEIGDFAVLVKQGMSNGTAFFWIIMSNVCGLGGVYSGIALGNNESVHQWMFAVTAGFFIYVALVDLMPEMLHDPSSNKISTFILYNIGLLLGWWVLLLLAYFEGDIGKNVLPNA